MDRASITGLVLAGGRGSRMGGVDKGLQMFRGMPLAQHALQRLAPQVGPLMLSANRHLAAYRAMGAPVWPDADDTFAGPLAGALVGLQHGATPYMLTVPCDSPNFPEDLAQRLSAALQADDADIAMAATLENGALCLQPVFCLMKITLAASLAAFIATGERKMERWTAQHRRVNVPFADAQAFSNANSLAELALLNEGSGSASNS